MSDLTSPEALAIMRDTALITILAIGLPIHAVLSLRRTFVAVAQARGGDMCIYIGVHLEKLIWWLVLRGLDFLLFLMCLKVWVRRVDAMSDILEAREREMLRRDAGGLRFALA
jgi:hypothetical protein